MVRVVAQRVRQASVEVEGEEIAEIGPGLAILVGIGQSDDEQSVDRMADKLASIRIFEDDAGKMNLSAADIGGSMLVISQFTLWADVSRGRRPSFISAAAPDRAEGLYLRFAQRLESQGYPVQTGRFGAHMLVSIENNGPVTLMLDSEDL